MNLIILYRSCWKYRNIRRDLEYRDFITYSWYSEFIFIVIVTPYIGLVYELWLLLYYCFVCAAARCISFCLCYCVIYRRIHQHSLLFSGVHTVCSRTHSSTGYSHYDLIQKVIFVIFFSLKTNTLLYAKS